MDVSTERISTAAVMQRYGLSSRTTLNQWFEEAGISSFKDGKYTYIYSFQLNALDAIAQKKKRPIRSLTEYEPESIERIDKEYPVDIKPIGSNFDLVAITQEFENLPPLAKWYAAYLILEQLSIARIVLPVGIVRILLGRKILPACKNNQFNWGNFRFVAVAANRQEWLVYKEL